MAESWPLEQLIKLQRSQPQLVQRALLGRIPETDWSCLTVVSLTESEQER